MKRSIFSAFFTCLFFLTIPALVAGVCPVDDTYINSNTILSGEFCNVVDRGKGGVLIINTSDIILDCNGTTLKGDEGSGITTAGIAMPCGRHLKNITIKNCKVITYMYGIEMCTTSKNKIFNNYVSNISNVGISLVHNSSENEIYNNLIESTLTAGVRVYEGERNRIYKNKIRLSPAGIMIINDSKGYCDENIITENFISECLNGIFYQGCEHGIISKNTITNSIQHGIFFNSPQKTNEISNNNINSSGVDDIHYSDKFHELYKIYKEDNQFNPLIFFVITVFIVLLILIYYLKRIRK